MRCHKLTEISRQTVTAGQAGSHHGKGWEPFTRSVMKLVAAEAAKGAGGGGSGAAPVAESKIASMFAKKVGHSVVQGGASGAEKSAKGGAKDSKAGEEGQKKTGVVFLVWGQPAAKSIAEAGINDVSRCSFSPTLFRRTTDTKKLLCRNHPTFSSCARRTHRLFRRTGGF